MTTIGKIRYVFTSSNTISGFHTFIPQLIEGLKKVYIIKGPAGSGKSTLIRSIGEAMSKQGYEVEFWLSASEPVIPDGVLIAQLGTAVINGSLPQAIDPKYPGAIGEIVNLQDFIDKNKIAKLTNEIAQKVHNVEKKNSNAYSLLKKGAQVKEQVKAFNSAGLDIEKLHNMIDRLAQEIFKGELGEKHYFASSLTPDGMVNCLDEISSNCSQRYVFKGPSGSGKSTVLIDIARQAREKGITVDYYHCGLDPDNLRMIIIRNLRIALIDLGDADIILKPWDVVIDMNAILDNYDRDSIALNELKRYYEGILTEAKNELENAYKSLQELKKIYSANKNDELIKVKTQELINAIINDY